MIIKKCSKCGKELSCFADENKTCWCSAYHISKKNLQILKENFDNCLCENCLKEYSTES